MYLYGCRLFVNHFFYLCIHFSCRRASTQNCIFFLFHKIKMLVAVLSAYVPYVRHFWALRHCMTGAYGIQNLPLPHKEQGFGTFPLKKGSAYRSNTHCFPGIMGMSFRTRAGLCLAFLGSGYFFLRGEAGLLNGCLIINTSLLEVLFCQGKKDKISNFFCSCPFL